MRHDPDRESWRAPLLRTSQHHRDRYAASTAGHQEWEGVGYAFANAELDRTENDLAIGKSVKGYLGQVEDVAIGNELPQPMPAKVGNVEYYRARHEDFVRRHPDLAPPDYYLNYGGKYAFRFTHSLFPKLSPPGKQWLIRARMLLALAIENRLLADPMAFDALEQNSEAFKDFAFESHTDAYMNAGLLSLDTSDQFAIGMTPGWADLLEGRAQAANAIFHIGASKVENAVDQVEDAANDIAEMPDTFIHSIIDRKGWGSF